MSGDDLMRGDQSAFLRALGHISLGSVEDSLDLGPDDRDTGRGYYEETGDHDEIEVEHDDQEPDGQWAFSTEAGCWIYE